MAEWLKAHAWKACLGEILTRVRIPPCPPDIVNNQAIYQRSFAPKGKTPRTTKPAKRLRLSLISTVTNRGTMRFSTFEGGLKKETLVKFLKNPKGRIVVDEHSDRLDSFLRNAERKEGGLWVSRLKVEEPRVMNL